MASRGNVTKTAKRKKHICRWCYTEIGRKPVAWLYDVADVKKRKFPFHLSCARQAGRGLGHLSAADIASMFGKRRGTRPTRKK